MPSLSVRCPRCQKVFKVDAALAGQATSCPHCQQGMVVPTPGPPPVASAPPVVNAPPVASAPAAPSAPASSASVAMKPSFAPEIQVKPAAASAPKPVEAPPPKRVLTAQEKAKIAFRANLIMLALGMIVLTVTMVVLLYLTDNGAGP
jgi:hypothetical protein